MSDNMRCMQVTDKPREDVATDLASFLSLRGCGEETLGEAKKNTYKYTDCGAWLVAIYGTPSERQYGDPVDNDRAGELTLIGFRIGSIVEGVDWDCTPRDYLFPFPISEFWAGLQEIETEAEEIWNNTHGCEYCPPYFDAAGCETHYHAIDENCPHCKGEGMII